MTASLVDAEFWVDGFAAAMVLGLSVVTLAVTLGINIQSVGFSLATSAHAVKSN